MFCLDESRIYRLTLDSDVFLSRTLARPGAVVSHDQAGELDQPARLVVRKVGVQAIAFGTTPAAFVLVAVAGPEAELVGSWVGVLGASDLGAEGELFVAMLGIEAWQEMEAYELQPKRQPAGCLVAAEQVAQLGHLLPSSPFYSP